MNAGRPLRRRLIVGSTVLVLTVGAGGAVVVTAPFTGEPQAAAQTSTPTGATAAVREGPLSAQVNTNGTLSYAGQDDGSPYTAVNQAEGIYTALPAQGRSINCGDVLYTAGDDPVPLLCGARPGYRALSYGDEGWDVQQLNKNLVDLGYATTSQLDPNEDDFTYQTYKALKELQEKIGADETGKLKLGEAVFLPGASRVSKVVAKLGTRAVPGTPVFEATSTGRQVTVELNAAQQSAVKVGDKVQITLPDNKITLGKVARIGTVANSAAEEQATGGGSANATIPVYVSLDKPEDAGTLDQAPVQVEITTDGVDKALIVPVTSLTGQAGGGYAVERVDAQGAHRIVPVKLGLFDNAKGLVQVTGELKAGDRVVVPST
ncbi:efflux RND transporter periplasmic adaptor subunit [Amycolatopsis pittospori]|uniref:efflux RND transporter periplasmic adaptor subunit n=1 Tax=Amycolatopsis pittospori TaxID=2749434 RepID=UPI0015F0E1BC|nr:hypothetical protein [Amycolatopsis pittospori]